MQLFRKPASVAGALAVSACALFGGEKPVTADVVIKGELTYRQRIALPEDAVAVIELREAGSTSAPIAEWRMELNGRQVPIPFDLTVSREALAAASAPEVRGGILIGGAPVWASDPQGVKAATGAVSLGALALYPWTPIAFATEYRCAVAPVLIGVIDEKMTMRVGGEDFALKEAPAASGAKYEAESDPTTWFWSKGEEATASVRGEMIGGCKKAGGESTMSVLEARGNEPGWNLEIAGDIVVLISDYGQTRVEAKASKSVKGAVKTWRAKDLSITWEEKICADDATGMPHPAAVTVMHAGKTLRGCGGEPKSLLVGGEWVVEDINGGGVIDDSHASLLFDDEGRVSGSSSCNRYGASYTLTGEGLAISRAAATLMACAPALMDQERKFFDTLAKVSGFSIDPTGALILTTPDGGRILARR
ncbi:MAG: META domain-containing protein [Parvularculaceae bacterium]